MNYNCPNCNSENTQKLEIAHKSGITSFSGTTNNIGVGITLSGLGVGMSEGNIAGTQQSMLSSSIKPPEKKRAGCLIFVGFCFLVFFCLILVVGLASGFYNTNIQDYIILCILLILGIGSIRLDFARTKKHNKEIYEPSYEQYKKKFICLRCGNIFIPE